MCLQEGSDSIFSAPFPELWSLNRKNYIGKGESTETKTNFSLQHLLKNSENGTLKSSTAPSTLHFPPFSSFQWHFCNAHSKSCPHRGLTPFPSYYSQLQQGKHWCCSAVMCQDRHLWTPVSQGCSISCMLLPLCRFCTQHFPAHSFHGMPHTCTTSSQCCFAAVPPFYPFPCVVPGPPAPARTESR